MTKAQKKAYYTALKAEINGDAAHYDGKTDQETTDILNAVPGVFAGTKPRGTISASIVNASIVSSDVDNLDSAGKEKLKIIVAAGTVDMNAANIITALDSLFSETTTRSNLTALETTGVSRAAALDFPLVEKSHVENALYEDWWEEPNG